MLQSAVLMMGWSRIYDRLEKAGVGYMFLFQRRRPIVSPSRLVPGATAGAPGPLAEHQPLKPIAVAVPSLHSSSRLNILTCFPNHQTCCSAALWTHKVRLLEHLGHLQCINCGAQVAEAKDAIMLTEEGIGGAFVNAHGWVRTGTDAVGLDGRMKGLLRLSRLLVPESRDVIMGALSVCLGAQCAVGGKGNEARG